MCHELRRRGHHAVNGDTDLAYQGDPVTGEPLDTADHEHHLWDIGRLTALVADQAAEATFFCGGSRNVERFVHLFDEVFVLEVDLDTLLERLDRRGPDEWGSRPEERELVVRPHRTGEDVPRADVVIDATMPLEQVVDTILAHVGRRPGIGPGGDA